MSQDLNQVHVPLWPFSCIRHATDKEVYFLCCDQKARTQVRKASHCGSKQ